MLKTLPRPFLARHARLHSAARSTPSDPPPSLPYFVPRNNRHSIPVYTDIRNGGTRYHVLIRNVHGNPDALADDLTHTLFPAGSNEAKRLSVQTVQQRHVILTGGRWKNDVLRWLVQKGF